MDLELRKSVFAVVNGWTRMMLTELIFVRRSTLESSVEWEAILLVGERCVPSSFDSTISSKEGPLSVAPFSDSRESSMGTFSLCERSSVVGSLSSCNEGRFSEMESTLSCRRIVFGIGVLFKSILRESNTLWNRFHGINCRINRYIPPFNPRRLDKFIHQHEYSPRTFFQYLLNRGRSLQQLASHSKIRETYSTSSSLILNHSPPNIDKQHNVQYDVTRNEQ